MSSLRSSLAVCSVLAGVATLLPSSGSAQQAAPAEQKATRLELRLARQVRLHQRVRLVAHAFAAGEDLGEVKDVRYDASCGDVEDGVLVPERVGTCTVSGSGTRSGEEGLNGYGRMDVVDDGTDASDRSEPQAVSAGHGGLNPTPRTGPPR